MEYTKVFKQLLREASDRQKFLAEIPYRRSAEVVAEAPGSALKSNEALFVMTDAGIDREGDVIVSAGVDTTQFAQFGSILWGHRADHPEFILGRPAEVLKEETRIVVKAAFLSEEANPWAAKVAKMVKEGGVRAMSVGIMVQEYSEARDRDGRMPLNITRSELVETSITPVPVNPRAVLLSVGEDTDAAKAVAEQFEQAAETPAQLAASVDATGLTEDSIKALVQVTVRELLGKHTVYSVPSVQRDVATQTLLHLARSTRK